MRTKHNPWFPLITAVVDAAMVLLAFIAAYELRKVTNYPPAPNMAPQLSGYSSMMVIQVISMLCTFVFYRLYHQPRGVSRIDQFYTILAAVSIGTMVATAFTSLLYKELDYPRLMVFYFAAFAVITITIGRLFTGAWQAWARARHPDRVLVVGAGDVGRMIAERIRQTPRLGYEVVGFADDTPGRRSAAGLPVLGPKAALKQLIRSEKVDEVVIALPEASHEEMLNLIYECEHERVLVRVFPDVFQIIASELSISDLNGLPMLTVRDVALRGWRLALKRGMDVVGSTIMLIVLSPLFMFIALLIKMDSPGPVFYSQVRMGLDARPFPVLKFRSMRVGAEDQTGAVWATRDDPRKTRLGNLLRRSSIDELPQLINVLLGDMSLVGPRPERPVFVEQFRQVVPGYMDRHRAKAGLTGWAQVNGLRGDTSIVERTKYDLYYVENWSLLLDIKILIRTLFAVLHDRNAY
ncbi:MAG TPA: undecaprenyl-phosphate glucose phosphotransferase [Anaerolineae bacterium]|nr:undecaprenyl-phosphate glucose phosphotransferase [Anaerolineae bacterium]HPL27510.1 undecaprenyl-phosphate glucose phosphotransferase [Anaerolineae bacterium]